MTQREIMQRLSLRGHLSVRLEMRPVVARVERTGHTVTTSYRRLPEPTWVVLLERPSLFQKMVLWDDLRAENTNLDLALLEVWWTSMPKRVEMAEL